MSGQETHEFGEPTLELHAGFLPARWGFQKRHPGSDQLFLCAEVQNANLIQNSTTGAIARIQMKSVRQENPKLDLLRSDLAFRSAPILPILEETTFQAN